MLYRKERGSEGRDWLKRFASAYKNNNLSHLKLCVVNIVSAGGAVNIPILQVNPDLVFGRPDVIYSLRKQSQLRQSKSNRLDMLIIIIGTSNNKCFKA